MTTVQDKLRGWARGTCPLEAGVELLIWLGKGVDLAATWIKPTHDRTTAYVDVDELLSAAGAWSGGRRRLVRIAERSHPRGGRSPITYPGTRQSATVRL